MGQKPQIKYFQNEVTKQIKQSTSLTDQELVDVKRWKPFTWPEPVMSKKEIKRQAYLQKVQDKLENNPLERGDNNGET